MVDFVDDGTADYLNLVIMSIWGETVDWRERPASVNRSNAVRRADGRAHVVVAYADPACPTGWPPPATRRGPSPFGGSSPRRRCRRLTLGWCP